MTTTSQPQTATRATTYTRFSSSDRMEHFALLLSFTMLGITGLAQRYNEYQAAKSLIDVMGGIESVRLMHRFFATILMATSIYHGGVVSYKLYVKRVRWTMLPTLKDGKDALGVLLYNLGLRKSHPQMPRYNFGEKAEYLAVVWGTLVMIVTGFMLWNPIASAKIVSGQYIPAARIAHSYEALLAVASILIWHMYNVHVKRFNKAMFTGKITHEAMAEEHGGELAEITAGKTDPAPSPEVIAKRKRIFYPYAVGMSLVLVAGLIYFVTFEDSALETVPRVSIEHVNPIDPSIGNAEAGATLWQNVKCQECHGTQGEGVPPIPAIQLTDLTIDEFAVAVRRGPADMPAFNSADLSDKEIADLYVWLTAQ